MNPKGKILYFDFTEKNILDKYSNFYFHEKKTEDNSKMI